VRALDSASLVLILVCLVALCPEASGAPPVYRVDHVVDSDTIALRNGQRMRLVQIDTPEVVFGAECYARAASRQATGLLPPRHTGSLVRGKPTDRVDQYGRRLRYVVRINGA
jgi:endonuclease YncB( thermonuclease family)